PQSHPPPSSSARLERAPWARVDGRVAALAVGDADGDGKPEVLVLTEHALLAYSPEGKLLATSLLTGARSSTPPRLPSRTPPPPGTLRARPRAPRVVVRLAQRDRAELFPLDSKNGRFVATTGAGAGVQMGRGQLSLRADFAPGQTAFAPTVEAHGERWTLRA